jgi:hypothetical protein
MVKTSVTKNLLPALAKAYLGARRHKRWKNNTLQFSTHSEENLLRLASDIKKRSYRIKPSLCFIALEPIKREIFAGDFRDRIIHHLIFNELNPRYDRLFINDCYSCRKKRGTDYGIRRISSFIKSAAGGRKQSPYILKLDISGYFMNIDRRLLYKKNKILITRLFRDEPEKINDLLYLLRLIIFNDPTIDCRKRGKDSDWNELPKNKSLFGAADGKGLPIGNLTSQLFGNVYLNDFDYFVKKKLGCRHYGRYVDDMVFVSEDKEFLKSLIPKVDAYLRDNLGLKLHPKKIYLQPSRNGLKFLGTIIKPRRIYVASRIKGGFYGRLNSAASETEKNDPAFLNSYLGLMKKYQTFNLRRKMLDSSPGREALKKLKVKIDGNYEIGKPDPINLFREFR